MGLVLAVGLPACAGVERAEVQPQKNDERARMDALASEIAQHEVQLAAARSNHLTVSTAVLRESRGGLEHPALGTAVLEVDAAGIALRIASVLPQGTHHVYLLTEEGSCRDLSPAGLTGPRAMERPGYLGSIDNVRDGAARFDRHLSTDLLPLGGVLGHPLVLVDAKGKSAVCGVFRATSGQPEDAISER